MDPITIGTAIGTTVVAPLAKELIQKAAQPETVAKGINWVFSAADHFLKLRRGQTSPDEPAPERSSRGRLLRKRRYHLRHALSPI
jgi:hypothetical protein